MKDAQIKLSEVECASGMGQRSHDAAVKDAQVLLRKEECALDMELCSNEGLTELCSNEGLTNNL